MPRMKLKFETAFRSGIIVLALLFVWAAWRVVAASASPPVTLISPEDGANFSPGTNIVITATVGEDVETVARLEFVADGGVIGVASNAPYSMIWSNVPIGSYLLTARATTDGGATMESASVHVQVYNTLLTFGLDRVKVLRVHRLFGIPLWQYCASLIYIFLAFYVSKLLDFLTRVWLKRWAEKTTTKFDDLLLELLNGPVKVVAFVVFLRIGLEIFSWPHYVRAFLPKAFTVIVAISLTYMVLKFIDLALGYWRDRTRPEADKNFDQQLFPVIRKSLKMFVVVVAVLVTLDNIGVNITAAIASLSIGGLAVGLAAQDTLANLFGAVAVFVDKPFRIGDRIQLEGVDGTVETIGLRSTRVRNLDGFLVTIPNKTMGNATITNIARRPTIKTTMNIGLTYDTPVEKVKRAMSILEEILKPHPMTADLILTFDKFADSSLNILVIHWWKGTDPRAWLDGLKGINLAIKERFDAEGINFAFPSRTVYLKQDSEWRLEPKINGEVQGQKSERL